MSKKAHKNEKSITRDCLCVIDTIRLIFRFKQVTVMLLICSKTAISPYGSYDIGIITHESDFVNYSI